ncbi:Arc family DNA binding domain-containing protein [Candidatus Sumerlaeota bacterium]|nr:Arc family DNA binding domain-containing protein [Candidatus Sumerlaeota bacterium]
MTKKLLLRINEKLWEEINRWARDELRSVNGQIEYILRQAVENRTGRKIESPPETTVRHLR